MFNKFTFLFFLLFLTSPPIYCSPIPDKPSEWDSWNFTQKIAWRGMNLDPRINYGLLIDKLLVKEVMKEYTLVPETLYATDDPSTISTVKLPKTYFMKANNACDRGLLVKKNHIIARHKSDPSFIPILATDSILQSYAAEWLSTPYNPIKEKQYLLVKPMILFEEYLKMTTDIQIFCFYGKIPLIIIKFREKYKEYCSYTLYDSEWNLIESEQIGPYPIINSKIDPPKHLDKMLAISQELTRNIDHVRVDFFMVGDDFYFSEFTFTSHGGTPSQFWGPDIDVLLGSYWTYPEADWVIGFDSTADFDLAPKNRSTLK